MSDEHPPHLRELSYDECLHHLYRHLVGRVALCAADYPVVVPINYRLVEFPTELWVVLRTRPGGVVDHTPAPAALQLDGIDPSRRTGWSVLVRGSLELLDPDVVIELGPSIDPHPWIPEGRERWLVLKSHLVTGREIREGDWDWAFAVAYL